jgi:hypothetical protein
MPKRRAVMLRRRPLNTKRLPANKVSALAAIVGSISGEIPAPECAWLTIDRSDFGGGELHVVDAVQIDSRQDRAAPSVIFGDGFYQRAVVVARDDRRIVGGIAATVRRSSVFMTFPYVVGWLSAIKHNCKAGRSQAAAQQRTKKRADHKSALF